MSEPKPESGPLDVRTRRLEVMISSTSLDLPDHRDRVIDAILEMRLHPLAMEHLGAISDSDAIKESYSLVDLADVYVGIFALRYGYRPEDTGLNPDKVSITELEYRRALERKIPILLFLAHEDHVFTAKQFEKESEAQAKLESLKGSLLKGNICAFFKSPENLATLVSQALSHISVSEGGSVPPSPGSLRRRMSTRSPITSSRARSSAGPPNSMNSTPGPPRPIHCWWLKESAG